MNKEHNDGQRFRKMGSSVPGKRLTYKELIGDGATVETLLNRSARTRAQHRPIWQPTNHNLLLIVLGRLLGGSSESHAPN